MSLFELSTRRRALAAAGVLALVVGAGACGNDDDGTAVREIGGEDCPSGSASASGSHAASGSEAASGSHAASGSEAASGSASGAAASGEECPSGSASGSHASGSGSEASGSHAAAECTPVGEPESADTSIAATLDDFSIELAQASAPAGLVAFVAENVGEHAHEIVVARVAPDDITVVDGAPDEEALGDALIGEIEAFPPGESCAGAFELEAGDYTLFCAIVETEADGTVESHFEEGMVTTFTVE